MVVNQLNEAFQTYIEKIKQIFPHNIAETFVHDSGDDFLIIEVNDERMFRFPRQEFSRKAFAVEKAFLSKFNSISPLPVPDYKYRGDDFGGYRKIRGSSLSIELFQNLSESTQERIARQLGQFLSTIHNFPMDEAKRIGLIEDWNGWYDKIIQNYRETVAPMLSPSTRKNTLQLIERTLAEPFEARVLHGDFALEDHVFFDVQRQELSGVIDFADVTINDPAHDFQNIVEYGSEGFYDMVMKHYQGRDDPTLLKRTMLRIETRPMLEASSSLLFGFQKRFKDRMEYLEAKYG
jgi:aminoglycoside 2''-phosphotransferase